MPVAVPLLGEALAAPVARVRFLTEMQQRVVYPIAHFGELMATLAACQDLVLAPSALVDSEGSYEHSSNLGIASRCVSILVVVVLFNTIPIIRLHAIGALLLDIVIVHALLFI